MHALNWIVDAVVAAFILGGLGWAGITVLLNWPAEKPLKGPRPLQR